MHFVRHPICSGILLALLGTVISIDTVQSCTAIALIFASFVLKLTLEEQWLCAHLGADYEGYRRQVKALSHASCKGWMIPVPSIVLDQKAEDENDDEDEDDLGKEAGRKSHTCVVAMLTRLIDRFDTDDTRNRES